MAEIVENFTFGRKGRKEAYPWDEWLDGQTRRLVQGQDFTCKPASMQTTIYSAAERHSTAEGIEITVETSVDGESVVLKATRKVATASDL